MACSSSWNRNWRYNVFTSFHGPDVRKTFLSHLRKQFYHNGISMFDDQGIERSQLIAPALTQAIRESKIYIVVLSKKYASSSWCLDELVTILECMEDNGQTVMTIFYEVDPSDVRKQTGEFGTAFNQTYERKTEEDREKWSKALNVVGNIAGEHFINWKSEAAMIEKIAKDVSDKLNATPSQDFDGMVGLENHLRTLESLLDLDNVGVKMIGISGPAGIGKSTIARALQNRISNRFLLTCFVDNLNERYHSRSDEFGLKLRLQEQVLSTILNQNDMRICHLGTIKERLCDQRVLIILDDVNNLKQLEALANETTWFGPGSRIIVTTENKELLQQHGIHNLYHVCLPSDEQALKIFCRYAFRQNYPAYGFEEFAKKVTKLCGNLPLGLCLVGSSLYRENEEVWEEAIRRLDLPLDHKYIEKVLRVGFESLHEDEQSLFLHIAIFFNYKEGYLVKTLFADKNSNVNHGLRILVNRSLIYLSISGKIVMHKLLQQWGMKVVHREEPWKRRILIDASEICDVLERAKGNRAVSGISFDISYIDEVSISERAFKRMVNLRFLKVYKSKDDGNKIMHLPEAIEFPQRLRLLHWEAYPNKCLPHRFSLEHLVELDMRKSNLEKLWERIQPLPNLKKMNLSMSLNLKELPDLSNALYLERLDLSGCESLIEIPSSIGNLPKLEWLDMTDCINLQAIPTLFNLTSLQFVSMMGCSPLRNVPDIPASITSLAIEATMLKEWSDSVKLWCRLIYLSLNGAYTEKIPDYLKYLHGLVFLDIGFFPKVASLPELPASLITLVVRYFVSLETLSFSFDCPIQNLYFPNCLKLGPEARRVITQAPLKACLPGREMPGVFDHRAIGNSLSIRSRFCRFRTCAVVSPKERTGMCRLFCHIYVNGCLVEEHREYRDFRIETEHVFQSKACILKKERCLDLDDEILFEFSTTFGEVDIIECAVQILTEETNSNVSIYGDYESGPEQESDESSEFDESRAKRLKT